MAPKTTTGAVERLPKSDAQLSQLECLASEILCMVQEYADLPDQVALALCSKTTLAKLGDSAFRVLRTTRPHTDAASLAGHQIFPTLFFTQAVPGFRGPGGRLLAEAPWYTWLRQLARDVPTLDLCKPCATLHGPAKAHLGTCKDRDEFMSATDSKLRVPVFVVNNAVQRAATRRDYSQHLQHINVSRRLTDPSKKEKEAPVYGRKFQDARICNGRFILRTQGVWLMSKNPITVDQLSNSNLDPVCAHHNWICGVAGASGSECTMQIDGRALNAIQSCDICRVDYIIKFVDLPQVGAAFVFTTWRHLRVTELRQWHSDMQNPASEGFDSEIFAVELKPDDMTLLRQDAGFTADDPLDFPEARIVCSESSMHE